MKLINIRFESIGDNPVNAFICKDNRSAMAGLLRKYREQVQTAYIDPPFNTGRNFTMRMRVGEEGYRTGKPVKIMTGYSDKWVIEDYMGMMRRAIEGIYEMLKADGSFFLHVDSRMYARLRLLCDEIFGEKNFINEIIWAYRSGGRGERCFAKKHDTILFYRKSECAYFDIKAVAVSRESVKNHMKVSTDEQGRTYRSIMSAGKIYKYYDDDTVFPSDVWSDIPHIQQRDPARTGFETQKPEKLLERIILATTRPGDIVLDIFAGSGTTLSVAERLGRRFIGVDSSPFSLFAARKRIMSAVIEMPPSLIAPVAEINIRKSMVENRCEFTNNAIYDTILKTEIALSSCAFVDINVDSVSLDALDGWAAGVYHGNTFFARERSERTSRFPAIKRALNVRHNPGEPLCVRLTDVFGRNFYFEP